MKATLKATLMLCALAAGETMTITQHLTKGRQKILVTRVEFEDGTAWHAERPEERKP